MDLAERFSTGLEKAAVIARGVSSAIDIAQPVQNSPSFAKYKEIYDLLCYIAYQRIEPQSEQGRCKKINLEERSKELRKCMETEYGISANVSVDWNLLK